MQAASLLRAPPEQRRKPWNRVYDYQGEKGAFKERRQGHNEPAKSSSAPPCSTNDLFGDEKRPGSEWITGLTDKNGLAQL